MCVMGRLVDSCQLSTYCFVTLRADKSYVVGRLSLCLFNYCVNYKLCNMFVDLMTH